MTGMNEPEGDANKSVRRDVVAIWKLWNDDIKGKRDGAKIYSIPWHHT